MNRILWKAVSLINKKKKFFLAPSIFTRVVRVLVLKCSRIVYYYYLYFILKIFNFQSFLVLFAADTGREQDTRLAHHQPAAEISFFQHLQQGAFTPGRLVPHVVAVRAVRPVRRRRRRRLDDQSAAAGRGPPVLAVQVRLGLRRPRRRWDDEGRARTVPARTFRRSRVPGAAAPSERDRRRRQNARTGRPRLGGGGLLLLGRRENGIAVRVQRQPGHTDPGADARVPWRRSGLRRCRRTVFQIFATPHGGRKSIFTE